MLAGEDLIRLEAGEGASLPNRRGLITYTAGALIAVIGAQLLLTLWAAHQASEGEHTAISGAVLAAL